MFILEKKVFVDTMHHAYLLEGERELILAELVSFLEKNFSMRTQGNPDFWHGSFDSLGVDDARAISSMQLRMPTVGTKKFFVISLNTMTSEAQNALLKVFEEPTEGTHFFIISPRRENFLPTLLSRLSHIQFDQSAPKKDDTSGAKSFLSMSLAERLIEVKKIADAVSLEKITKAEVVSFLNSLERALYSQKTKNPEVLEDILYAKRALSGRSPSVKLLLESLALSV